MTEGTSIEAARTGAVVSIEDLDAERAECRFVWPPLVIAVVLFWIVPLATSFGNDEASNWWVIKDGLREAIARATGPLALPGGQSVFYNLLPLAAQALGAQSEMALRLPSVLAMLGAALLIYRIGARLAGPLAAMFGCLVFVTMADVVFVASTLRPYGLAMLCLAGAMLAWMNWLDTGRPRYAVAYAVLAALTVYAHDLFAIMYLVHAMYALVRLRARDSQVTLGAMFLAWLASGVLLLPLAPANLRLLAGRGQHVYAATPDVGALLASVVPPLLAGAIGLGMLLQLAVRRPVAMAWKLPPASAGFLATWALAPPLILYLVSLYSGTKLFVPRYYLPAAPAAALLAGSLIRAVQPAGARRFIAGAILICSLLEFGIHEKFARGTDGWREAAQAARERVGNRSTPVLAVSGFVEARTLAPVLDPLRSEVLFAPLLRYPTGGRPVRLPFFSDEAEAYLADTVVPQLRAEPEFLLLGMGDTERYEQWLDGRLGETFRARTLGYFSGVKVVMFKRRSTPGSP
jgi:hypothetical protein